MGKATGGAFVEDELETEKRQQPENRRDDILRAGSIRETAHFPKHRQSDRKDRA